MCTEYGVALCMCAHNEVMGCAINQSTVQNQARHCCQYLPSPLECAEAERPHPHSGYPVWSGQLSLSYSNRPTPNNHLARLRHYQPPFRILQSSLCLWASFFLERELSLKRITSSTSIPSTCPHRFADRPRQTTARRLDREALYNICCDRLRCAQVSFILTYLAPCGYVCLLQVASPRLRSSGGPARTS